MMGFDFYDYSVQRGGRVLHLVGDIDAPKPSKPTGLTIPVAEIVFVEEYTQHGCLDSLRIHLRNGQCIMVTPSAAAAADEPDVWSTLHMCRVDLDEMIEAHHAARPPIL